MSGAEPCSPTKKEKHRFEITKKLGSGTYGKVSLAYDHKFDREVRVLFFYLFVHFLNIWHILKDVNLLFIVVDFTSLGIE